MGAAVPVVSVVGRNRKLGNILEKIVQRICVGSMRRTGRTGGRGHGTGTHVVLAQVLFLLNTDQILRHILQPDISQVLIIFNLVEDRAPDGHFS